MLPVLLDRAKNLREYAIGTGNAMNRIVMGHPGGGIKALKPMPIGGRHREGGC
jgi:hypothetical protein